MAQDATILTRALQTESLPADIDRLINDLLLESGVFGKAADAFKVSEDTGSNLQVVVGSGTAGDKCVIKRDDRVYILEHQNASHTLALAAADANNDRIDLIVARVYDDEADSSGNTYGDIEVIQGTPAAVPAVPDVPDGAIALAQVLVEEDATAVTDTEITDLREEIIVRGQHVQTLVYTATGTHAFTKADYPWLRKVRVRVQGAGGAGGGAQATTAGECSAGAGGQGGAYVEKEIAVEDLGTSETVTVGTGGAGNSGAAGSAGGNSSFGSHAVAGGGAGGTTAAASSTPNGINGPNDAQIITGDVGWKGGGGGAAIRYTATRAMGGMGGSSYFGGGGAGTGASTGGSPGGYRGGGGGGSSNTQSQSAQAGGNGGDGVVIVDLYA